MKQQQRTMIVLAVAVITAGIAAYGVHAALRNRPVVEGVRTVPVVLATTHVSMGTRLTADHLRVVPWPSDHRLPGAFSDVESLIGRGAIATIYPGEPVTAQKVAGPGSGAGLSPVIAPGMRAYAVPINDVVGVAGFVVPGTRVDVLLSVQSGQDSNGNGNGNGSGRAEPMARTVLGNVKVLTAGTRFDSQAGESQRASVVTVEVTPEDAERLALANTQGRLSLALRNPADDEPTRTPGIRLSGLMQGQFPEPPAPPAPRPAVRRSPPPAAPPPVAAAPAPYRVEAIRGGRRSEEEVAR